MKNQIKELGWYKVLVEPILKGLNEMATHVEAIGPTGVLQLILITLRDPKDGLTKRLTISPCLRDEESFLNFEDKNAMFEPLPESIEEIFKLFDTYENIEDYKNAIIRKNQKGK